MVRIVAYCGAVGLCYLLYRFSKGAWNNHLRSSTGRDGRAWNLRKDVNYTRLAPGDRYDDEDEGYHDSESVGSPSTPKLSLQKQLPDKPLPPIPNAEFT
jgi:hypothetical protein